MTPAERAAKENTVVRVCAAGHSAVTYYVRRDRPEPPCPACSIYDTRGVYLAPPQPQAPERPAGPHEANHDARRPVTE